MGEEIREEFELQEVEDSLHGSVGSRLSLFSKEFGFDKEGSWENENNVLKVPKGRWNRGVIILIHPNGRKYKVWMHVMFLWSIYSTFFTPLEFGFFRGLPEQLLQLECVQLLFLVDVVLKFFVAYRDAHTYRMVYDRKCIALRYLKGSFALDILGCVPWDAMYKMTGRMEIIRYFLWLRLYRARKIMKFFQKMEKDIRINYLFTRIVKLITVELYCTHTAACIFYYLATTVPPAQEGYTWIGSLTLGDFKYINFREIDFMRRYITSLYFSIVTMATVGYGDIHAVNTREMVFIMIFISFDMVLSAYLIGNMTAIIVKGSQTERFRDKMTDLIKYMNRNQLGKEIRSQIKDHLKLQYESSCAKHSMLEDIPISIRSKVSQTLYMDVVQKVPLFKGCSEEFLNQLVIKLNEEFFVPGEVILEQGHVVDQIYIVCHGFLEAILIRKCGLEKQITELVPYNVFGDVAVLCNIPQPYTVRVSEVCQLLRIDKQSFNSIIQLYFKDSHQILSNLLKGKETDIRIKQLESDITYLIAKQERELILTVNNAAYHGDLHHLKGLINAGADPSKSDYDGRTALHVATCKGYEEIVKFLIQRGTNVNYVNCVDSFGNTPLLEAVKFGHDRIAKILVANGAILTLEQAGNYLCNVVTESKLEMLRRLLEFGVDPNSKNYDLRTPLHVAAAEGLHLVASVLIEFGADVLSKDRWGNTPLDEAERCGSKPLLEILEKARQGHLIVTRKHK
ncbi:potassium channel KOR2-like protein [Carex littledalei]|uniref:Potassium channel n=1 Tax=Carex littledalei TaxID=544730 RepID=A0A833RDG3_9POAL|nr:potassium channel KOR2-like protein [Carex littledalei]